MKSIMGMILFVGLLVVAACRSVPDQAPPKQHTLAGNPRLNAEEQASLFDPAQWEIVRELTYDAYVVLSAQAATFGPPVDLAVVEAWPDHSRDSWAMKLAQRLRIEPFAQGGGLAAGVEIYVVWYESSPRPRVALVFARHLGAGRSSRSTNTDRMLIRVPY